MIFWTQKSLRWHFVCRWPLCAGGRSLFFLFLFFARYQNCGCSLGCLETPELKAHPLSPPGRVQCCHGPERRQKRPSALLPPQTFTNSNSPLLILVEKLSKEPTNRRSRSISQSKGDFSLMAKRGSMTSLVYQKNWTAHLSTQARLV